MRIERMLAGALIGCTCLALVTLAAAEAGSPYRLNSAEPQAFRVGDGRPYQLAEEYRLVPARTHPQSGKPSIGLQVSADLAGKPFAREIELAARRTDLDPALVHAIIHVESRHQHQAISPKGAIGLMQVLPDTAARYGITNARRSPQANLTAGTLYVRDLMQMFDEQLDLVLAAYNAGEGAVQRYANRIPPYRETQLYVRAVLAKYGEWGRAGGKPEQVDTPPNAIGNRAHVEYLPGTRLNFPAPALAPER
jgi:soluble lytic murein transglycosylase-like protein